MSAVRGVVGSGALLALTARLGAAAVLEGVVTIPDPSPPPAPGWRYPARVIGEIGEPDRPAAVVSVETETADPASTHPSPREMAQHRYQFAPGLIAIRTGDTVRFPNLDDEYHSVFSYSKPKRFDLGRYRKDERPAEITFERPGVVRLYCEIHDHMRGTIVVVDTPYFAKTDAAGRYRIEGVPAGRHRVKAWVEPDEARERVVELADGETARVDFGPE